MIHNNILFEFDGFNDFIKKLIPSWVNFVVQFAALIILLLVVIFVAYKPVKKILAKRQEFIESNIRQSEEAKAQAIIDARQAQEMVLASKKEAAQIVAIAHEKALQDETIAKQQTEQEIALMKQTAMEDIKRSEEEAQEAIRQEMINVALAASSEILKREVNEKDEKRFVEDFIKEVK